VVRPLDHRLLRHARASRRYVVLTAVLGLATALAVIAQALLLAHVIAAVAMDGATPSDVADAIGALSLVVAVRAAQAAGQERFGHRAATAVIAQLRAAVLERLGRLGPAALEGDRGPALATLTTRGLDALDGYLTRYLPQLLLAATVTPAVLAVIWWQDMIAALTITITLPLVPAFMALVGWSTAALAQRRLATMTRMGGQVLDLIAGLPTLRALGRDRGQATRVREVGEAYRRATMGTLRSAFLSALVLESLTTLSVALVAVGIGLRLVVGELDLRTGLAVLILAPEVYLPLRMVGVHYHASVDGLAAAAEAFAVLEHPLPSPGTTPAPDLRRSVIMIRAVSVAHPGRALNTPHALDLDLRPGEVVALVGPSGVGKSTAVEVLLGLRRPDAGQVLVCDGEHAEVDLTRIEAGSWHRQIAWVPQRPLLVPGTLAENAWLGLPGAPDPARLARAASAAGLDDVVAGLPRGWATRIGQGGHGLSAGQRQRLALTRALARDAALVILDEPTAHLDAGTEQAVHRAIDTLRRGGSTVLLVAHRPALATLADHRVLVGAG
jgi:ATP-binding cassette subfamily C protein CydD